MGIETEIRALASKDYLWEYAAILFWEHVLSMTLLDEDSDASGSFCRYSKLA